MGFRDMAARLSVINTNRNDCTTDRTTTQPSSRLSRFCALVVLAYAMKPCLVACPREFGLDCPRVDSLFWRRLGGRSSIVPSRTRTGRPRRGSYELSWQP